jgi:Family of unknown function (DUF6302)
MSKNNQSRQYYLERLADPSLLERAVIIKNCGPSPAGDHLAVPVGGSRRGGYLEFIKCGQAERALTVLSRHAGFPNLHIVDLYDKYYSGSCFALVWGEPQTRKMSVEELGRYYGYTEESIKQEVG